MAPQPHEAADELRMLTELVQRRALAIDNFEVMIFRTVLAAREKGASWSAVGDALGWSRQRAHQTFAA